MTSEFSVSLKELPTFLSTISMVQDDDNEIVKQLIQAERKSPPVYEPAREHFIRVLEGKMSFEAVLEQANKLKNTTERSCALDVLKESEKFLREVKKAPVRSVAPMSIVIPNGLSLQISPIWIRETEPTRLMILYFWKGALTKRQLSAAAATLKKAISQQRREYSESDIDFISVSIPTFGSKRRFESYSWQRLKPLTNSELEKFWSPLISGWAKYQRQPPRRIRRRGGPDLFGK